MFAEKNQLLNCIVSGIFPHSFTSCMWDMTNINRPPREVSHDPYTEILFEVFFQATQRIPEFFPNGFTGKVGVEDINHAAKI